MYWEKEDLTLVVEKMFLQYPGNDYIADFAADVNGDIFANTTITENLRSRRIGENRQLGVPLINIDFPVFNKEIRTKIVNGIVGEIRSYFPDDETLLMEVLSPSSLPSEIMSIAEYSAKIRSLCRKFLFDVDVVDQQFHNVLREMMTTSKQQYLKSRLLSPQVFWSLAIQHFDVGDELKFLIHHILVLPVGSADAERAFSILFHIRSKRRSRFSASHLEDNLRLRMNGPPAEELIIFDYKKAWLEKRHMEADDPVPGRGKSRRQDGDNDEDWDLVEGEQVSGVDLEDDDNDDYQC